MLTPAKIIKGAALRVAPSLRAVPGQVPSFVGSMDKGSAVIRGVTAAGPTVSMQEQEQLIEIHRASQRSLERGELSLLNVQKATDIPNQLSRGLMFQASPFSGLSRDRYQREVEQQLTAQGYKKGTEKYDKGLDWIMHQRTAQGWGVPTFFFSVAHGTDVFMA